MKRQAVIILFLFAVLLVPAAGQAPPRPYGVLPTEAQLRWHEMEMYVLVHFGMDTYTDKEWGYGDEDPAIFNPKPFDANQIVQTAKAGGFKGVVVVAKHHDGFCLWPTKTTEHNITKSPWKNGKGDIIKEFQQACEKAGMKLGLYCSPWDRNSPAYGSYDYVQLYREQLKELYSSYGPLFISWHDGANGGDGYYGGTRETRKIDRTTYYGWDTTWAITRAMQPGAVLFGDVGPDVRWVGNEEGFAGETSWATYTPVAPDEGKLPANGYVKYWEATEGTRNGQYWMPAECDVPLRPGWFYHAAQDEQVKSPYTLLDLYYKSVGRGANLDLGIAPNRDGLLHANDVKNMTEFGRLVQQIFAVNLAKGARFTASNIRGRNAAQYGPSFLLDDDRYSYWATDDKVLNPQLTVDLGKQTTFNVIRLRENIKLGQRITSVAIEAFQNNQWKLIATATSIGSNRLIRLPQHITASKVRLRVTGADAGIALSDFGLFKEPQHLSSPLIKRDKKGLVTISTEAPVGSIRYTLNGREPTSQSPLYTTPFQLSMGGLIKARSFDIVFTGHAGQGKASETAIQTFDVSKAGWKIVSPVVKDDQAARAIDENPGSFLATLRDTAGVAFAPQEIIVDMGKIQTIRAFTYLPRQDKKTDGTVDKYEFSVSNDGVYWGRVATGEFANIRANPIGQIVFPEHPSFARYFKFSALQVVSGNGIAVAELGIQSK
ncbi:MAG: alpha-L-fucosidase [Chitinophagaceae bacterium]